MASVRWIVRSTLVALLAPLMGLSVQAQAQPVLESPIFAGRELHIDGLDVEEVPLLVSGTSLNFTLFGSSGAAASLQIDGARRALSLRETGRGVYEGTYTIDDRERIAPDARVVATLRRGTEAATSVLDEPLVLGAPAPQATSRQAASGDPVQPRRSTTSGGSAADAYRAPPSGRVPAVFARACSDCAVVESIRRVETGPGDDGVAGAIVGGLLGMILGNQVAGHDTRPVARLVGAVGGALAGRAIERSQGRTVHYDVLLRRPDGSSQVHRYDGVPPLRVGETVRLPAVTYAQTSRPQSRYADY
jgi:outer membrane lipoprotein SlyB